MGGLETKFQAFLTSALYTCGGHFHDSINHSLIKRRAAGWTTGIQFLAEIFLFAAISI
jgi:hypothetical protein